MAGRGNRHLHLVEPGNRPDTQRIRTQLNRRQRQIVAPRCTVRPPIGLCSDLHLPLMDVDLFEEMLDQLAGYRVKFLAIVGDLFDQEAFSSHPAGLSSPGNIFQAELDLAREVLLAAFQVVDHICILPGNHDVRIFKTLKYQLGMWDLIRIVLPEVGLINQGTGQFYLDEVRKSILVSRLPRIDLTVQGEPWVQLHPQAYSRVRGRIATQFADLEEAHVAIGHVHHHVATFSSNGKWNALELGGLFDPKLINYVQESPRPGTAMTNGYFILTKDGPVGFPRLRQLRASSVNVLAKAS